MRALATVTAGSSIGKRTPLRLTVRVTRAVASRSGLGARDRERDAGDVVQGKRIGGAHARIDALASQAEDHGDRRDAGIHQHALDRDIGWEIDGGGILAKCGAVEQAGEAGGLPGRPELVIDPLHDRDGGRCTHADDRELGDCGQCCRRCRGIHRCRGDGLTDRQERLHASGDDEGRTQPVGDTGVERGEAGCAVRADLHDIQVVQRLANLIPDGGA